MWGLEVVVRSVDFFLRDLGAIRGTQQEINKSDL